MKLTIHKSVTVITPTVGKPELQKCIDSVRNQTYSCNHLIIIDGKEYDAQTMKVVRSIEPKPPNAKIVLWPWNTGSGGFYGHRIYAAYPHLVNSDYILFLDEDNWYEPNHVETLIDTIEKNNLHFSYSLRKIFDKDGNYLCDDNCESLGRWPIFFTHDNPQYLIDTSSFCFRREWLIQHCQNWHWGWGGDRHFFYAVKDNSAYYTNGLHTLCYRLDGNPNSVTKEFFDQGNSEQYERYGGKFPWHAAT